MEGEAPPWLALRKAPKRAPTLGVLGPVPARVRVRVQVQVLVPVQVQAQVPSMVLLAWTVGLAPVRGRLQEFLQMPCLAAELPMDRAWALPAALEWLLEVAQQLQADTPHLRGRPLLLHWLY